MSLKTSIVVVNQYTLKSSTKSGGSRGGTPGAYITRYMARDLATEPVTPRRTDLDDFITGYMARSSAVEELVEQYRSNKVGYTVAPESAAVDRPSLRQRRAARSARRRSTGPLELKERFLDHQGDGGVAFGHSGPSLSHQRLHGDSREIQELFDSGKTVLKTVLSFEHDYLVANGLVPEGLDLNAAGEVPRGGYRGHLDQLKLRMSVMEGLTAMARAHGFDDLRYVGVIQVDTSHVHCHLAMVDAGRGRLARDGTQRGKLSSKEIATLRRSADAFLDRNRKVAHLSSAVGHQRRSVSAYIKKWAYQSMSSTTQAQFVLSCLPEDRRLWRASTNRKEMAKANRLVRALVLDRLEAPGSPLPAAMAQVREYADERMVREGLSAEERETLMRNGRERIIEQAMNGVYSVLAAVPSSELTVSTAMLSTMSTDFDALVEQVAVEAGSPRSDGKVEVSVGQFALRLRSYSERLARHRELAESYRLKAAAWEDASMRGLAAEGSEAMHEFYRSEEDYHSRCVSKYQHFLDFAGADPSDWREQWSKVEDYGSRVVGLRALRKDASIQKMSDPATAERLGREIYGQPGGALLAGQGRAGRAQLDGRIERMEARYRRMVEDLIASWRQQGHGVDVRAAGPGEKPAGPGSIVLSEGSGEPVSDVGEPGAAVVATVRPAHVFEHVKGIDMHDMGVDWTTDQPVGRRTAMRFAQMAAARSKAADKAELWLVGTGQAAEVREELGEVKQELSRMRETAGKVSRSRVLPSLLAKAAEMAAARRRRAIEELEAAEAALAAQSLEAESLARDAHEGELEALAAEHGSKPIGRTARLDSALGPAVNEAVESAVRAWRAADGMGS